MEHIIRKIKVMIPICVFNKRRQHRKSKEIRRKTVFQLSISLSHYFSFLFFVYISFTINSCPFKTHTLPLSTFRWCWSKDRIETSVRIYVHLNIILSSFIIIYLFPLCAPFYSCISAQQRQPDVATNINTRERKVPLLLVYKVVTHLIDLFSPFVLKLGHQCIRKDWINWQTSHTYTLSLSLPCPIDFDFVFDMCVLWSAFLFDITEVYLYLEFLFILVFFLLFHRSLYMRN